MGTSNLTRRTPYASVLALHTVGVRQIYLVFDPYQHPVYLPLPYGDEPRLTR